MEKKAKQMGTAGAELAKDRAPLVEAVVTDHHAGVADQRDHAATIEILKKIVALGYRITPPADCDASDETCSSSTFTFLERLKSQKRLTLVELVSIWNSLSSGDMPASSEVHELLGTGS